jgi:hypothetical protein
MGEFSHDEASNELEEQAETKHVVDRAEVKGGKEYRVDKHAEEVSTDKTANANADSGGLEHETGGEESQHQGKSEADGKSSSGGHPSIHPSKTDRIIKRKKEENTRAMWTVTQWSERLLMRAIMRLRLA